MFEPMFIRDATPDNLRNPVYRNFLRRAVADHLVLVLPRYGRLSAEAHLRIASVFGPAQDSLDAVDEATPESNLVQTIERNNPQTKTTARRPSSYYWHTDRSFLPSPAYVTLLNMWRLPVKGGDTHFVNTRAAFSQLLEPEKWRLRRSRARHSYSHYHNVLQAGNFDAARKLLAQELHPDVWHPLVVQDPTNGLEAIYFSELCVNRIEYPEEAAGIAPTPPWINQKLSAEDLVYRHSWHAGDLLIWNNLATMHRSEPSVAYRQRRRVVTDCLRPIDDVAFFSRGARRDAV